MASPRVLEDVAGPAADPDPGDQGEDDVLRADAGREAAVDADLVGLRLALEERLRREDHLDLARPDPERERPERAMGRGVGIAADDRHPGLGQAQLRADDVDDSLARRAEAVERDAELLAVARQLVDLGRCHRVGHRQGARMGRRRVVRGGDGPVRVADPQAAGAKPRERLRRRDLVDEVEVDREDRRCARLLDDDVVVPDLLDDRSRLAHDGTALRFGWSPERSRGRAGRRSGGRVGTANPLVPPVLVLSVRIGAVEGGVQQGPHVRRRGAPDAWLTPGTDRGRAAPQGALTRSA